MIKTKHYGVVFNAKDNQEIHESYVETDAIVTESCVALRGPTTAESRSQVKAMPVIPRIEIPVEYRALAIPRDERKPSGLIDCHREQEKQDHWAKPPPMVFNPDHPLPLTFETIENRRRIEGGSRHTGSPSHFALMFSQFREDLSEEERASLNVFILGEIPSPSPREEVEKKKVTIPRPVAGERYPPYDEKKLDLNKKVPADFVPAVYTKTTVALDKKFEGNKERMEKLKAADSKRADKVGDEAAAEA